MIFTYVDILNIIESGDHSSLDFQIYSTLQQTYPLSHIQGAYLFCHKSCEA